MTNEPLALGRDPDELDAELDAGAGRHLLWATVILVACVLAWVVVWAAVIAALILSGWILSTGPRAAALKLGIFLALGALAAAWYAARLLWVPFSTPQGILLSTAGAPNLWRAVRSIEQSLGVGPVQRIILTPDFRCEVLRVPRLGLLGWPHTYLLVGLPLLQGLSAPEAKAMMAQAMYPLTPMCGRWRARVQRMRGEFEVLVESLEESTNPVASVLVRLFWPAFQRHAIQVSRGIELDADARAAHLAGSEVVAGALMRAPALGAVADAYWGNEVRRTSERDPEPPKDTFLTLGARLQGTPPVEVTARALRDAFVYETQPLDAMPLLVDRLCALGSLPRGVERGELPERPPPMTGRPASSELLGEHERLLTDNLSAMWCEQMNGLWPHLHAASRELREKLAALPDADAPSTTVEALWERAELLSLLEGHEHALPVVQRVLARQPDHAAATMLAAEILLDRLDGAGFALARRAMELDPAMSERAFPLLATYAMRSCQAHLIPELQVEAREAQRSMATAIEAWKEISPKDTFLPHTLDASALLEVREVIQRERDVARVFLVRKDIPALPRTHAHIMMLDIRPPMLSFRSATEAANLVTRVSSAITMGGYTCVLALKQQKKRKRLAKVLAGVPGSLIYDRDDRQPPVQRASQAAR